MEKVISAQGNNVPDDIAADFRRLAEGQPFLDGSGPVTNYDVNNIHLSRCMECRQIAIWIHQNLIWPLASTAPDPNPDLGDPIVADYREAAIILPASPRGAAALLRLCIQKLCKQLGEPGKDINSDIASLVAKGLDRRVEMALDIVRVIGNESVHPGQIDLRDDRGTAEQLFGLVNLIADIMISQPKHIASLYSALPEDKRKGIEQRNQKALAAPQPAPKGRP